MYLNKILLSSEASSIPAPLFVTWFQCVVTCGIVWIIGEYNEAHHGRSYDTSDASLKSNNRVTYNKRIAMSILPLSFVFVGMVAFNNLCLKFVQVSFYNVARSLTICFNVVFTYYILSKPTSLPVMLTLVVVIIGFVVGSDGEIDFSVTGTVFGVTSSIFVSLNSIYTKKSMKYVDDNESKLLFVNNLNAVLIFTPLVLYLESDTIASNLDKLVSPYFWLMMTLSGVFGYLIGLFNVLQVSAIGPLGHNVSGTAKAAVQSLMAFHIWGNEATAKGLGGIFTVLFGSGLFAFIKMKEGEAEKKAIKAVVSGELKDSNEMTKP